MLALEALKLPFLKHTVVCVSDFSRKFRGGIRRKAWGIFIQVTRPCKATNFIVNIPQHISCWVILFPWLFPGVSPHRCVTRSSSGGGKCQGKEEGTSLTSNFSQIYMSFSLFLLNKFSISWCSLFQSDLGISVLTTFAPWPKNKMLLHFPGEFSFLLLLIATRHLLHFYPCALSPPNVLILSPFVWGGLKMGP